MQQWLSHQQRKAHRWHCAVGPIGIVLVGSLHLVLTFGQPVARADEPVPRANNIYSGLYLGGHLGYVGGRTRWTASEAAAPAVPTASGSFGVYQPFDAPSEAGSFVGGLHVGYDRTLANRVVVGVDAGISAAAWPTVDGLTTGGRSQYFSAILGAAAYTEAMQWGGHVRARAGWAPGSWLYYATGGLAWSYDRRTVTAVGAGEGEEHSVLRTGWTAGAGVEAPIAGSWTGKLEYLSTRYGKASESFATAGQRIGSTSDLHELRLGLNYRFGLGDAQASDAGQAVVPRLDPTRLGLHAQATYVMQAHPSFRSPYTGTNSMPALASHKSTIDVTLFAGVRLWQGAEVWFNPEIDQGFGFGDTHGVAGFPSAESYKLGSATPYARIHRAFVRQTLDLGGERENVQAMTPSTESRQPVEAISDDARNNHPGARMAGIVKLCQAGAMPC